MIIVFLKELIDKKYAYQKHNLNLLEIKVNIYYYSICFYQIFTFKIFLMKIWYFQIFLTDKSDPENF